jgi:HTH-type transcriptional regulator / antitoxin HigA
MIKSSGKMITTINHRNYIELLDRVKIVPKVIETETEYDRFLAVVEGLLAKRQSRTLEETALFVLLVKLVEDYEREHYSIDDGISVAPHKFLQHMMEAREMEPKDLAALLNISEEFALSVVNGEKQIDLTQALALGDYFKVNSNSFHNNLPRTESQFQSL